jgi:hypothetical protein
MGRRSTPIRRTSFVVNQGRKSNGRMSAAPTATIVRLSVRRWQKRHRKADPHLVGCFAETLEAVFEPQSRSTVIYTENMLTEEVSPVAEPTGGSVPGASKEGGRRYEDLTHFLQAQYTRASLEAFSSANIGKSFRDTGLVHPSRSMVFGRMAELFAEPLLSRGRSLEAVLTELGLQLFWGLTAQPLVQESDRPLEDDEVLEFRIGGHWECRGFQPVGSLMEISPAVLANSSGKAKAMGYVIPPPYFYAALVQPEGGVSRVIHLFRIPVIDVGHCFFSVESNAERGPIRVLSNTGVVALLKLHVHGDLRALGRELWPFATDENGHLPSRPDLIAFWHGKVRIVYLTDSVSEKYHQDVDRSVSILKLFLATPDVLVKKIPAKSFTPESWVQLLA